MGRGCPRVIHIDTAMPPAIKPNVTDSENTGGILPMMPTKNILVPINTNTKANAYFKYLKRCTMAASAKYSARKPKMAKMLLV